jgi:hypothetical protein
MLREIFEPKRDVVRREWRRLQSEGLCAKNPPSNNNRVMK